MADESDGAEVEIYVFWASIVLIVIGVIGAFLHHLAKKDNIFFEIVHYLGLLGLIMLPAVFAISAAMGRLEAFLTVLKDNPIRLLESFQLGSSLSDACMNGICATYCCESSNGGTKWKDCVEDCSSKVGAVGVRVGDNCKYDMERPAVCKLTGQGDAIKYQSGLCNHMPSAGPVTCFCCVTSDDEKWWDCDADCSGRTDVAGTAVNVNTCIDTVHRIECKDIEEENDDIVIEENNYQSF